MGSGELFDQTVSPQQSEFSADGGRAAFLLLWVSLGFEEKSAEVSVAKSVDFKLTAIDCLQEGAVLGRPGIECSGTVAVSLNGFTNFVDPLEQGNFSGGGRECREVTGIGGQGDLGASFEVNHASAQNTPGLFTRVDFSAAMGTDLSLAKDAKVSGLVDGRFNAQDAALFVVHLKRVGIEGVFDSNTFRALFQIADHFSFKIAPHFSVGSDSMAQKAHNVCTGKAGDSVPDQRRINPTQRFGVFKHDIGGIFALLGCPVVR